jgi:starch synthase
MRVVMAASEASPLAQTGGLGDVLGSLPPALQRQGVDVAVVIPGHRSALQSTPSPQETGWVLEVPLSRDVTRATVLRTERHGVDVFLIRADPYFDREHIYGDAAGDYLDNATRFTFFSRAVLALLERLGPPAVLHCHDWPTALAPVFLRADASRYHALAPTSTALTIHNIGYQGLFWHFDWHLLNLDWKYFSPECLEFYGKINFLKGGIICSDAVTTVSPTHAREIQTPQFGFGLEGLLFARADSVVGILNGADYGEWDPQHDPLIARPFGPDAPEGKRECKAALQQTLGLPQNPDIPLLGVVSRLVEQKGIDVLLATLPRLLRKRVQVAILGSGDRQYETLLSERARRSPKKLAVRFAFDRPLSHKIIAGSDIFVMPSRYEPCGLTQMYSMRYGTVPVVHATGGLEDSVADESEGRDRATGFKFLEYNPQALAGCIERAVGAFRRPTRWRAMQANGMRADFSWDRAALSYQNLYRHLASGSKPNS